MTILQNRKKSPAVKGLCLAVLACTFAQPSFAEISRYEIQQDAFQLLDILEDDYAYADRFELGVLPVRAELEGQIPLLDSVDDLIGFSERALHALYDHHAITGAGSPDAYGLVPSFADLWIEVTDAGYEITDVRHNSVAEDAAIRPGCLLTHVAGRPIEEAVASFIGAKAVDQSVERQAYAARVLAAGRRDRVRRMSVRCAELTQTLELPNLYQSPIEREPGQLTMQVIEKSDASIGVIRFNDSLGALETIEALDGALAEMSDIDGLILDLRDTASGGNTLIARGILSRFVDEVRVYQRHILPFEERDYGVARSWQEEVTPRGEYIDVPLAVLSGRWTGSMGEGMTIALDAMGAEIFGSEMAGLLGGISDNELHYTGMIVKFPTERLTHINGLPREDFVPEHAFDYADALTPKGEDAVLQAALTFLAQEDDQEAGDDAVIGE